MDGCLTPVQKEVLYLYAIDGLTAKQISKVLGRSEKTIESHLERIRIRLRIEKSRQLVSLFTRFFEPLAISIRKGSLCSTGIQVVVPVGIADQIDYAASILGVFNGTDQES